MIGAGERVNDFSWRHMLSPAFFVAFVVTFSCCYVVSPFLSGLIFTAQQREKAERRKWYFHSILGSALHAVEATLFSSYILFISGELGSDRIFSTSLNGYAVLQLTLGYVVADFIVCLSDPYLRSSHATLLHHLAMFAGIFMGFYHQLFMFFMVYRLLSELSTPWVDLRIALYEIGEKQGKWYIVASYGMMVSFFLCRVMVIPWHTYALFTVILSPQGALVPLHLRMYMVLNFGVFDFLNVFWFYKMIRGAYKHFKRN